VRIDSQIGLEPTFAEYVETMRAVFAEVRRMLRKDGTLWLNLGDSYCSGGRSTWRSGASENKGQDVLNDMSRPAQPDGLKPKDLIGIPWRVAFALQADGWYLRQDIIWSKPNPMPESVTDRCTKAHEYLFLLAKSERYYYDADAIAETLVCKPHAPGNMKLDASRNDHDRMQNVWGANGTRNRRSVWEVASAPFSEAHFATFPPALIEPCILAGCPKQCCAKCGAPWVREVKREGGTYAARKVQGVGGPYNGKPEEYQTCGSSRSITVGWSPSCSCSAAAVPGTVLDPFGGAGTTGLVADRLGRNAVLIELNPQYADMAEFRVRDDAPLFVETSRALAS
jgi:DNA modification methylase